MFTWQNVMALIFVTSVAACGKSTINIDHSLGIPHTNGGGEKPSADCTAADNAVSGMLAADRALGFDTSSTVFLADGTCAVTLLLTDSNNVSALMDKYKATSNFFTYVFLNKVYYSVWIDQPPEVYTPTKDKNGNIPSTLLTDDDCNFAQQLLVTAFPGPAGKAPTFTTMIDQTHPNSARRCYVEAMFDDDVTFKSFLTWNNPTDDKHEPFHIYRHLDGVTKTIWVQGLRSNQN